MPRLLKELIINDVSSVDRGAGEGVRVMLMKRDAPLPAEVEAYWKREFSDTERQSMAVQTLEFWTQTFWLPSLASP